MNDIENTTILKLGNQKWSIRKIAKEVGRSTSYVSSILQRAGKYNFQDKIISTNINNLEDFENNEYIAICKKTGKEFEDFKNKSGIITTHLKQIFPEIIIPTGFKRRMYYTQYKKFWYYDYFDFNVKIHNSTPIKKCPYCEWSTKDLSNKSGMYYSHLKNTHNTNFESHFKTFPEEISILKSAYSLLQKSKNKNDEELFVVCKICNKAFKNLSNTHLKTHSTTLFEYKIQYPSINYHSKSFIKKTTNNLLEAAKLIKHTYSSVAENEIADFIENDLKIPIIRKDRKILLGSELDIIIPSKNLAIEYNGLIYHSELYGAKNKNYHLNKTDKCLDAGLKLIHIFEDDWIYKKNIVLNKIKHILGTNSSNILHARKCIISEIDYNVKNNFLNLNHIQGEDISNIYLGAFYGDELIAVMTFDQNRVMTNKLYPDGFYELKRFSTLNGFIINGIASRLLKFFIQKYSPKKIISFADRTLTPCHKDNIYVKLGFTLTKTLLPDYKYFDRQKHKPARQHKFGFGKNAIKRKFPHVYDSNKTEWEMMQELGYDRIWDCGKFKYELDLS